jgi:hypothetical protein
MPGIRVIKKSSSKNILAQSIKHLLKTRKRSKLSRRSKHSRKLRNSLTHHARLNKLQYGGSEHLTQKNKGVATREELRSKAFLALARAKPQISSQVPVAQPLSSVNIELVKQKIMRATGIKI